MGNIKHKTFLLAVSYGILIASIRISLIHFQIGYSPVDYGVYKNVSSLLQHGLSIYDNDAIGTYVEQGLPFVYTPFSAIILYPLGYFPEPLGVFTWTFLNAILLFYIVKISINDISGIKIFLFSLMFSSFNIIAQHFMFGQINIILCFLCLYDLLRKNIKVLPRGILIGIAAGIKLTPALFIAFFLFSKRWKYFIYSSISFLITVIIGFLFTPHNTVEYFTSKIFNLSSVVDLGQNFSTSGNSSIQGVISRWTGNHDSALVALLSLFVISISFIAASRLLQLGDYLAVASIIGVASCLLSPVSWLHHWVWAVPSIIWLLRSTRQLFKIPLAVAWSLVCMAQGTDSGDYLASVGAPLLFYEFFRSSLVLCGILWIMYMFANTTRRILNNKTGL
ncbi:glycosyltransferase 87 family protein [Rothia sp. P7208]|uniref:glycosyltransferase 87 family protein n=1 Tax=Rothia sp. P7208 TaxID=3402660 RepID=UPI003AC19A03